MAIVNGYVTLSDLKTYLTVSGSTEDARLESAIEAASRAIDTWTRRRFYATSATKYFQGEQDFGEYCMFDDDLLTITEVSTDDQNRRVYTAWSASDYEAEPYNEGPPYNLLRRAPESNKVFPVWPRGVRITGTWGYSTTAPQAIAAACLILAARYYKRKDAPFGVIGTPELGFMRVTSKDPEVIALLEPYRRLVMVGV